MEAGSSGPVGAGLIRVEVKGIKEATDLIAKIGANAPRAVERAVQDAGFAAQRSLVRCYRKLGKGGRHIADSVSSPIVSKRGLDTEATVGIGHQWARLVEEGATIPVNQRDAQAEGRRGIPMLKRREGNKIVFRSKIGTQTQSYTIKGAGCIPPAIKEGQERLIKTLENEAAKLTKGQG